MLNSARILQLEHRGKGLAIQLLELALKLIQIERFLHDFGHLKVAVFHDKSNLAFFVFNHQEFGVVKDLRLSENFEIFLIHLEAFLLDNVTLFVEC